VITKETLLEALKSLGVQRAGTFDDPSRWSVADLATDLADKLATPRGPCGWPYHAADCDCDGSSGER
jgi:hypothetical protein